MIGQNKSAAKAMIQYLPERKQVEERKVASSSAEHRGADVQPRNPSGYVDQGLFRAIEREGDRLGEERAGRLHALTT